MKPVQRVQRLPGVPVHGLSGSRRSAGEHPRGRRRLASATMAFVTLLAFGGCQRWLNGNVVENFFTAFQARSLESTLALFHDDATVVLPEQSRPFEGTDQIRNLLDWWLALDAHLVWDGVEPDPDDPSRVLVGEIRQSDRMLSAFGIPEIRRQAGSTFTIDGGMIRRAELGSIDSAGLQAMARGAARFQSWLGQADPQAASRLNAGEPFSPELAALWDATLERYVDEAGPDTGTSAAD